MLNQNQTPQLSKETNANNYSSADIKSKIISRIKSDMDKNQFASAAYSKTVTTHSKSAK